MKTSIKLHLFSLGKYVWGVALSFFFTMPVSCQNGNNLQKNQPDVHIHVKRELDKNGNVVRYDSTYSWTWSSTDSATSFTNDSIFFQFFPKSDLSLENPFSVFENDSVFLNSFNFFDFPSYIDKQMELMLKNQEEILKQHQSIINQLQKSKPIIPEPNVQQQNQQTIPEKKPKQQGIDL